MLGEVNMKKMKHLPWDEKWMGMTGYVEVHDAEEIPATFSYGIDGYGRFFLFIKIRKMLSNPENGNYRIRDKEHESVIIIFRRYTDGTTVVTQDCKQYNPLVDNGSAILSKEKEQNIRKFLDSQYVAYEATEWTPKVEISLSV